MKNTVFLIVSALVLTIASQCGSNKTVSENSVYNLEYKNSDYKIEQVEVKDVHINDKFWLPIIQNVQKKTIAYAIGKCNQEGRFDNFLIAGNVKQGTVRGQMPFDDSDVYKIIEGASNSLISSPNKELESLVDSLVTIIKIGQEKDGYLTTWRTINPAKPPAPWVKVDKGVRWEYMNMSHEEYNAGHLYEAAVVHYKATGKRNLLDIAIKNADLFVKTFGDGEGKILAVPGHQIIETGLIKLYGVTGNKNYLTLSKFFLDHRGDSRKKENFGAYAQDSIPVIQQREAVGHAVRAVYMYAGMTDIAAIYHNKDYHEATDGIWDNMVNKKMYVTGGIGARHDGEAFGKNYELPNLNAYNETCAAIGNIYWNQRMFNLSGDNKYIDVIEKTLYNAVISGISLSGTEFFYPNPLESDGNYKFNRGSCTRQSWFDCSCCPTNLIRFIPSIPNLIYAHDKKNVFVNLFVGSEANVLINGNKVKIAQETEYPVNSKVIITINADKSSPFSLKIRIPSWARNEVLPGNLYSYQVKNQSSFDLKINGTKVSPLVKEGYIILDKKWSSKDVIELNLPMNVQTIATNKLVKENLSKTAISYGPFIYAVEEIDNKSNFDLLKIDRASQFKVTYQPNLLKGINVINFNTGNESFTAIPYYAWANRGVNKMKVWIPNK